MHSEDIHDVVRILRKEIRQWPVPAIGHYEGFSISPDLIDAYTEMVRELMTHRYSHVTRYSTNGFLRFWRLNRELFPAAGRMTANFDMTAR